MNFATQGPVELAEAIDPVNNLLTIQKHAGWTGS